jgi:lipoprotein signal peptidase
VNELGSRVEDSVRFILIWGVPVLLLSILLAVLAFRWQKQLQDRFDIGLGLLFFGGLSNVVLPLQGVGVIETLVFQLPFGLKVIYFNLADTMIWVGLAHILLNRAMKLDWASVFVGRRPRPISPLS